jgi:methylation protein EvaC
MKCKITNNDLKPFMTFGKMPSANGFLGKEDFNKEFFYEMEVGFSEKVSLLHW